MALDLSRYLRMFSGVPGAPARPGVPVDRRTEIERELAPVFTALADAQNDADQTVARANAEADQRRAEAVRSARRIVEEARAHADETRTRTASAEASGARAAAEDAIARGCAEADRVDRAVRERLASTIDAFVARAVSEAP